MPPLRALYALRLRVRGILAYAFVTPALVIAAMLDIPELATHLGKWLGRAAYSSVVVAPPDDAAKGPLRDAAALED